MDINVIPLTPEQDKPVPTEFAFGSTFSNRMYTRRYDANKGGWQEAEIGPYGPFSLDPATAVFHYGQEIFEGTKAYRRADGNVNLFRPWENAKRFNISAERMCMAQVDPEEHLTAITTLVEMEAEWVPDQDGSSLYIRPFMIATDPALGVHASKTYIHSIICGPVGAYFASGFNPVAVYISDEYIRSSKGGVGSAKTGGNYAASLYVSEQVKALGYSQVLWLDAAERKYVEEVGAMNIAFVYEGKRIVTPKLSDSILHGITRDSVLKMAPDLGYTVEETRIDINEALAAIESGEITEVFGMGTAAVIAPVGKFGYRDKEYIVNNNESGPVATHLFKSLTDIQYGRVPDPYGWTHTIELNNS